MQTIKAAKKEYDLLKNTVFVGFKLGLLHGKMKSKDKEEIMSRFINRQIDILISTAVVEVGIDVPNANIIIIEGSERFGLAQLHQLRGRVGRSNKQAYCFLFTEKTNEHISKRLKIFTKTINGFDLAEYDLKIRGAGELYGTMQHGVPNLKIASLTDFQLIEKAYKSIEYFINKYKMDNFLNLQKRIKNYRISVISRD
jgi:ATP-dependent DNA helicase RecG